MEKASSLNCPACNSGLYVRNWHGVQLDICSQGCFGIWFDYGELQMVEQSDTAHNIDQAFVGTGTTRSRQDSLSDPSRQCPRDNTPLTRYEWNVGSGLFMDSCAKCHGIWLDAGELEKFVAYVKPFREHPPQLPHKLREQMDEIDRGIRQELHDATDSAATLTVPWDIAYLDDILRGVLKMMLQTVD